MDNKPKSPAEELMDLLFSARAAKDPSEKELWDNLLASMPVGGPEGTVGSIKCTVLGNLFTVLRFDGENILRAYRETSAGPVWLLNFVTREEEDGRIAIHAAVDDDGGFAQDQEATVLFNSFVAALQKYLEEKDGE